MGNPSLRLSEVLSSQPDRFLRVMWIKIVWIHISCLLMKPADLDLHYFQKRVGDFEKVVHTMYLLNSVNCFYDFFLFLLFFRNGSFSFVSLQVCALLSHLKPYRFLLFSCFCMPI